MNEDLVWCINYLKNINHLTEEIHLTPELALRALMNITMPLSLSDEFYERQDKILKRLISRKETIDVENLEEIRPHISIVKSDIVSLKADAIVDAGNEKLLGCFQPLHGCVDNAIHSFAGLEVRRDLLKMMEKQGHDEACGLVKVTKGYNLQAKYIFHTVGPQIIHRVNEKNERDLKSSYLSCLKKADEMHLKSPVFPSISTGIYGYPIEKACKIAINVTKNYLLNSKIKRVVFDLFSQGDYDVYFDAIEESYR